MRRPIVRAVLVVLFATAAVLGVVFLGDRARDWLLERDHYTVAVADLQCQPPQVMTRLQFLAEVQYYGASTASTCGDRPGRRCG